MGHSLDFVVVEHSVPTHRVGSEVGPELRDGVVGTDGRRVGRTYVGHCPSGEGVTPSPVAGVETGVCRGQSQCLWY